MKTFVKDPEKMTERELRLELMATRRIIDDIYLLTKDSEAGKVDIILNRKIIHDIASYCNRAMP